MNASNELEKPSTSHPATDASENVRDFLEVLAQYSAQQPDFKIIRDNSNNTPFFFSNDYDMDKVVDALATSAPASAKGLRVAILVGESYFSSILPELSKHADLVVFTDIDPAVLAHNEFIWRMLLTSQSRDDFIRQYKNESQNPILTAKYSKENMLVYDLDSQQLKKSSGSFTADDLLYFYSRANQQLKTLSFMDTEARFIKCRNAAKSLSCAFLNLNLFDIEAVTQVAKMFRQNNVAITVINASNLYYHDAELPFHLHQGVWRSYHRFEKALNSLLSTEIKPIIIFSRYLRDPSKLHCTIANHCDEMISDYHKFIIAGNMTRVCEKYKITQDFSLLFRTVAYNGTVEELFAIVEFNNIAPHDIISLNSSGNSKMTALHQAVRSGNADKVRLLLTPKLLRNQIIKLNTFSENGSTPLHIAWDKNSRNLEIFEALLVAGADPNIMDKSCPSSVVNLLDDSEDPEAGNFLDAIQKHSDYNLINSQLRP